MDLRCHTVKMKVLNSFEDPEEMAMLLISSEDNIDIDEDSWVTCYFSAEQTATLPLGACKYVIELIQPDGGDPLRCRAGSRRYLATALWGGAVSDRDRNIIRVNPRWGVGPQGVKAIRAPWGRVSRSSVSWPALMNYRLALTMVMLTS